MSATIHIQTVSTCYVCNGQGMIRLNHAACSTCWNCIGGQNSRLDTQIWMSYERCLADLDPFQNGAYSTLPCFYVDSALRRWEIREEDSAFAGL